MARKPLRSVFYRPDDMWSAKLPTTPGLYYRRFANRGVTNMVLFEVILCEGKLVIEDGWKRPALHGLHGYEFCGAVLRDPALSG